LFTPLCTISWYRIEARKRYQNNWSCDSTITLPSKEYHGEVSTGELFWCTFWNFENRNVHDVVHNYKIIYTLVIIDTKDLTSAKIGEWKCVTKTKRQWSNAKFITKSTFQDDG
jgi:hypothetical protein